MSREKKKGTSGNAKAFITRAKAIKKLQLSIEEFRRLCILKGIYPRNPRKKVEGSDKTYYLRKDIDFLAHERLIWTIREQKAHRKKVVKARTKSRLDILKHLSLTAPKARLDHLVVERYPQFEDALRELDDPLCIIALFANLPAERRVGITPRRIASCQRLFREFCHFVAQTRALTKVFVSIKGYYFQANVCGVTVTWITPHRFSQLIPANVDFSVMLTFLELYECLLSFVNFRLYTGQNLAYPPKVSRKADASALQLGSLLVEEADGAGKRNSSDQNTISKNALALSGDALKAAEQVVADAAEEEEELDEEKDEVETRVAHPDGTKEDENDGEQKGLAAEENKLPNLFTNDSALKKGVFYEKSVVLGREVPYIEMEFVLKAAGATQVTREDDLPTGNNNLDGYSHWIIDRPSISGDRCMSLEYVQPQYVFDSINAGMLLPVSLYSVGAHLPPHLSPFVTAVDDGGYKPWYQDMLERIKSGDKTVVAETAAMVYAEGENWANKTSKKALDEEASEESDEKEDPEVGDTGEPNTETTPHADSPEPGSEDATDSEDATATEGDRDTEGARDVEDVRESDEDMEEQDSEGEEEKQEQSKKEKQEEERKEMATLMLSRKKMKKYRKLKGAEDRKSARKEKLVKRRLQLAEEREGLNASAKKRKVHKKSM